MIGDLLTKNLKDLKGKKIIVVMDDGLAFLGNLEDFDGNTLILRDVYQAPSKKIKWKYISDEETEVKEKIEKKEKVGYIEWTHINLEEVYVRTEHVLRIWHWKYQEDEDFSKTRGSPVYARRRVPDERGVSMGDIQDTFG